MATQQVPQEPIYERTPEKIVPGSRETPVNLLVTPEGTPVVEAPAFEPITSVPSRSGKTYLRMQAHTTAYRPDLEVCCDTGTGLTLVGDSFLRRLGHLTEERLKNLKGVG